MLELFPAIGKGCPGYFLGSLVTYAGDCGNDRVPDAVGSAQKAVVVGVELLVERFAGPPGRGLAARAHAAAASYSTSQSSAAASVSAKQL
jgi:hypothetical protein